MTREEARQIIADWLDWLESCKVAKRRGYIEGHYDEKDVEAFRIAIEALSQPIVCKDHCIDDDHIYCSPKVADRVVEALSANPEPLSDAYVKAVWTWLLNYQIEAAELKGKYTPYEVLSWVANDWRKEHE